jgi:hypothetical protein
MISNRFQVGDRYQLPWNSDDLPTLHESAVVFLAVCHESPPARVPPIAENTAFNFDANPNVRPREVESPLALLLIPFNDVESKLSNEWLAVYGLPEQPELIRELGCLGLLLRLLELFASAIRWLWLL